LAAVVIIRVGHRLNAEMEVAVIASIADE